MFKLIKTSLLILYLIFISFFVSFSMALKYRMFHFIFFLIYVGAILVLIVYLFFSSSKISFKKVFFRMLFISIFFLIKNFRKKFKAKNFLQFSSEFQSSIYIKKELMFIFVLCLYIIIILFCIIKLDSFRFSSLRRLF